MKSFYSGKFFFVMLVMLMLITVTAYGASSTTQSTQDKPAIITMRIGGGHTPQAVTWVKDTVEIFMPSVDAILAKTGNYKIEWIEAWGGTIAKVDETLEAVETQLLDIGWVGFVFESAKLPLGGFHYRVPFASNDVEKSTQAYMKVSEKHPEVSKEFEKYNQKFLGIATADGYALFTNFEVKNKNDLEGKKIGAAGANLAWLEGTGSVPVQISVNECYSSLQTKLLSGVLMPITSMYNSKVYEVAPYVLLGDFNAVVCGGLSINMDVYTGLPEEVQEALIEAGNDYAVIGAKTTNETYFEALKKLEEVGARIESISFVDKIDWANSIANLPKAYAEELSKAGYEGTEIITYFLESLEESGIKQPRDWMNE